jgi:hypothetical protein
MWIALAPETAPKAEPASLAILVGPNQDVTIPSSTAGFVLDPKNGIEETIIYSRIEPDRDLEALVKEIQAAPAGKGFYELLAPDLPDFPAPASMSTENDRTGMETSPSHKRGIAANNPGDLNWPQLPPSPTAYVRFEHQ